MLVQGPIALPYFVDVQLWARSAAGPASQPTSQTGLHPTHAGIPPAPRGTPQIEVSFEIDANGEALCRVGIAICLLACF